MLKMYLPQRQIPARTYLSGRQPSDAILSNARERTKDANTDIGEARILERPMHSQGKVACIDQRVPKDGSLLACDRFQMLDLVRLDALELAILDALMDRPLTDADKTPLFSKARKLERNVGCPESAAPNRDSADSLRRHRNNLVEGKPPNVLKRVVENIAKVLKTLQVKMQEGWRLRVFKVDHIPDERQQTVVVQQDAKIADWAYKVLDSSDERDVGHR